MSPNGNGGVISSLYSTGALSKLQARGVKYLNVLAVDNILARHADPEAIGFHIKNKLTITSKNLLKKDPAEKVGLHILKDGKPAVI